MSSYYIYKNSDGEYAGSGISPIRNATHNFTEVAPDRADDDSIVYWDGSVWGEAPSSPHTVPGPADYLPPPAVPQSVTPRQIRLALIDRGIMPEQITQMLSGIEDEVLRAKALAEWEFASEVKRDHPLIAQLAGALEFTDEDVDEVFREAKAIGD